MSGLGPIGAVRLFVDDLAAARRFYRDVLGLAESWSDGATAAGYAPGGCQLIVEAADPDAPEDGALAGRFAGLSFTVADMDAAVASLSARGVAFTGPPAAQDWGGTLAHFLDPSGNVLSLVQMP